MNKICLILACIAVLSACNKNQVVPTTVTIISSGVVDTFTITDNGITYTDTMSPSSFSSPLVGITEETFDYLTVTVPSTVHFPISVLMNFIPGPATGAGLYTLPPADSILGGDTFVETFNNGQGYTVDSVAVDLTSVSKTLVTGTYQLWLTNIGGSKTVSGIIKCHHPVFQ